MPDWVPINWGLIKNPANWIIILLMVLIATFAISLGVDFLKDRSNRA